MYVVQFQVQYYILYICGNNNNNLIFLHLQTRQTHATGAGFSRVVTCRPAPAPMTTHDRNPCGFIKPSSSLAIRSTVAIDGWEIVRFRFLWISRLRVKLERLEKCVKPMQTSGKGVQDTHITIDSVIVEDSIMTEPNVVGVMTSVD